MFYIITVNYCLFMSITFTYPLHETIRVPLFLQQQVMRTLREKLALAEHKLEQSFQSQRLITNNGDNWVVLT